MPLSLPRDIFATVSPGPYLLANLDQHSLRANGRKTSEFRRPVVNVSSLGHCFGSAVARVGDTAVVCGVRGEILLSSDVVNPPNIQYNQYSDPSTIDEFDEAPALRLLVPNVELATGSSPANLPGAPPSTLAQSLSQRILSLLHSTHLIDTRDLKIIYEAPVDIEDAETPGASHQAEVKAYWTLYIDILFISLDGNPFDAAWGAMLAALKNVNMPRAWWDPDTEMIVCSDSMRDSRKLSLQGLPVASSFAVFNTRLQKGTGDQHNHWPLADLDDFEEGVCDETLCLVVDCSEAEQTRICRIEKNGGIILGPEKLSVLVSAAAGHWKEWEAAIRHAQH